MVAFSQSYQLLKLSYKRKMNFYLSFNSTFHFMRSRTWKIQIIGSIKFIPSQKYSRDKEQSEIEIIYFLFWCHSLELAGQLVPRKSWWPCRAEKAKCQVRNLHIRLLRTSQQRNMCFEKGLDVCVLLSENVVSRKR